MKDATKRALMNMGAFLGAIGLVVLLAVIALWVVEQMPIRGDAGNLEFALGVGR